MVDQACANGWTLASICAVLEVGPSRVWRWCQRAAEAGDAGLVDGVACAPVHGLTPGEQAEILAVVADWEDTDRWHRKLAPRGSYEGRRVGGPVDVSPGHRRP